MADDASHDDVYHPKDALGSAVKATLISSGIGGFVSALQNTLSRQSTGALGFITRTGGTIAVFGTMGGLYDFGTKAAANLREKEDPWNAAIGGFISGSILGLRLRSLPMIFGYGTLVSATMYAFDFTGGRLDGTSRDPEVDEYERKMAMRKNRRRPVEETLAEIGEGRGIHGPGWAERRAARLKEKYGIEVPLGS